MVILFSHLWHQFKLSKPPTFLPLHNEHIETTGNCFFSTAFRISHLCLIFWQRGKWWEQFVTQIHCAVYSCFTLMFHLRRVLPKLPIQAADRSPQIFRQTIIWEGCLLLAFSSIRAFYNASKGFTIQVSFSIPAYRFWRDTLLGHTTHFNWPVRESYSTCSMRFLFIFL